MKKIFLLSFAFLLTACGQDEISLDGTQKPLGENVAPETVSTGFPMPEREFLNLGTSEGSQVIIYDFVERKQIGNPLIVEGKVPSNWIFEGSFPITLLTDRGEVVKEWYGVAEWIDEDGNFIEGPVDFRAEIEYEAPGLEVDMGILRFGKNLVAEDDQPDLVEMLILWP